VKAVGGRSGKQKGERCDNGGEEEDNGASGDGDSPTAGALVTPVADS
jgi:hypothetical protein